MHWSCLLSGGIAFAGHGESFGKLKLGRDRNSVDLILLIKSIPSVAAFLKQHSPAEHSDLICLLYNTLEQHPQSAVRDLYWDNISNDFFQSAASQKAWHGLIADLLQKFKDIHGVQRDEKVPTDSTQV